MRQALQIYGPCIIERGVDTVLEAWSEADVTSATASVYDEDGELVGTYAATGTNALAATVPAADTAPRDYSDLWRVQWTADGRTQREAAYLVRLAWVSSVVDRDIFDEVEALDPSGPAPITERTDFAAERLRASREMQSRLSNRDERPWLIFDTSALRIPHLMLSIAKIFDGFVARGQLDSKPIADHYRELYEAAWARLAFRVDRDQDGQADSNTPTAAAGPVWLCSV